jgi:hypothetical protein
LEESFELEEEFVEVKNESLEETRFAPFGKIGAASKDPATNPAAPICSTRKILQPICLEFKRMEINSFRQSAGRGELLPI